MSVLIEMNLWERINQFDNGLHTYLSESANNLSFGERQLLSFCRMMIFDYDVIILDEATSSIDGDTEKRIQEALQRMIKDKTAIVIAHRLSTIRQANKIIVMDKGEIKEFGTHQQLLEQQGYFYKLYTTQLNENTI